MTITLGKARLFVGKYPDNPETRQLCMINFCYRRLEFEIILWWWD